MFQNHGYSKGCCFTCSRQTPFQTLSKRVSAQLWYESKCRVIDTYRNKLYQNKCHEFWALHCIPANLFYKITCTTHKSWDMNVYTLSSIYMGCKIGIHKDKWQITILSWVYFMRRLNNRIGLWMSSTDNHSLMKFFPLTWQMINQCLSVMEK